MLKKLIGRTGGVALGTAAGHGLVLIATPVLARRYEPAEFGLLALLMTVSNVSIAGACLRYDLAMPSSPNNEARSLLGLSVCFSIGLGLLTGLLAVALGNCSWASPAAPLLEHPFMVGCCVAMVGCYQAMSAWFLQRGAFGGVAGLRFSQGASFSLLALLPALGLAWAQVASFAGGVLAIGYVRGKKGNDDPTLRAVAMRHWRFPVLSLPGALLDVCGFSLCIWVIDLSYGHAVTGNYAQVQRLIGAPLMLLSISLGQVLLKQTAEIESRSGELLRFVTKVLIFLAAIAFMGIFAVWFFGEPLLRLILGAQWHVNREQVTLIAIAVFVRACVSPLSTVLITLRRFGLSLIWQSAYFCSAISLMPWVANHASFPQYLWFYAGHELAFYSFYLILIFRALRDATVGRALLDPLCGGSSASLP